MKTRLIQSALFLTLMLFAVSIRAADIFWTNVVSGNWTTAANWNPNTVPTASDTAVITNAGTYTVTLATGATVSGLTLGLAGSSGLRTLQITAGTLVITNTFSESNGVINLNGGTMISAGSFNSAGAVNENSASSSWRLLTTNAFVNYFNQTNGELRGGTLTLTNCTWIAGNWYADAPGDKTIIATNGVLNFPGTATRSLTYYAGGFGRYIDNYGTWNWTTNSSLVAYPSTVNNYGTVNISGTGAPGTYSQFVYQTTPHPVWNNYGTVTKSPGTNLFYFACDLNNYGTLDFQSGTVSFYASRYTNAPSGSIFLGMGAQLLLEAGSSIIFSPGSALTGVSTNAVRLDNAVAYMFSTNISIPSLLLNDVNSSLQQNTNNVIPTINQNVGTWQMNVPGAVNTYNLNGGQLRGMTLTVTNLNWFGGDMNADTTNNDRTIIPPGGVFNFTASGTRSMSHYPPAPRGRGLDNYGTWNWSGLNSVLAVATGGIVNNYSNVNVTTVGVPGTYAEFANGNATGPVWNNFGTFTKSPGTNIFYFASSYVNNFGTFDIQSGQLSFYGAIATNMAGGLISLGTDVQWIIEVNGSTTLNADSRVTALATNSLRMEGSTLYVNTTNISLPSLLLNHPNSSVQQNTNNVIPTINQNAGVWVLNVPTAVNTYNLNSGQLRGMTLTVTNLNWSGGDMYATTTNDDRTIIPVGGVLNYPGSVTRNLHLSAPATRGRGLDNYGNWNWSGTNSSLAAVGAAVINNFSTLNVTGNSGPGSYVQFVNGSGTSPIWNNFGNVTKTGGTSAIYITGSFLNNFGTFDIQAGQLIFYGAIATNLSTGVIQLGANSQWLNQQASTVSLNPGSRISGGSTNGVEIDYATVQLTTTNISISSLLLNDVNASLQQHTNNVIPTINEAAGLWRLNVPVTVRNFNLSGGELRGANLTVTNFNWTGGAMNSDGAGSNLVTVVSNLNISGNAGKTLSYWTVPGRSIINNGTGTWSGANIVGQGGATIQNNGSLTQNADTAFQFGGLGAKTVFQNNGTFTKANGTNASYFAGTIVTNSGTFNVLSGSVRFGDVFIQTTGSANLKTNFQADLPVRIEAGTLTGAGNVDGIFYNNGTLNPGTSPGVITGTAFTNSIAATLNIELGGTLGGSNYDQIRLSSTATLNGNLNVQFVNGFVPVLSNAFTVLTFASRSGTFANISTPPNFEFTPIYTTTNLTLLVTGLTNAPLQIVSAPSNLTVWQPEPATFTVVASGNTPLAYQWQFNGTNIVDATNSVYSWPVTVPTNSGLYTIVVTDSTAVQTNVSATLTVIPFDGTIYWTNTLGGVWDATNNWNPHRIPGATNTAMITNVGSYIVTMPNAPITVSNVILGLDSPGLAPRFDVSQNTFTIGKSLRVGSNSVWFIYPGATFTGAGDVRVFGTFDFYGGVLTGTGRTVIETNGVITLYNSLQHKYVAGRTIENFGNLNYTVDSFGDGNSLEFSASGAFTNHPSGIMNLRANGLVYQGANSPRSYFVNYGSVSTGNVPSSAPTSLGIDVVNYGTIVSGASIYFNRGTNYGTLQFGGPLAGMSFLGDETGGEYFSFEPGTALVGVLPNIYAAGLVRWNAPNTIHNGGLYVGFAAGGYSSAGTQFLVNGAYTNTYQVSVGRGEFKVPVGSVARVQLLADTLVNGFWSYVINNLGTIVAANVSHTSRNFDNSGLLIVRTNMVLAGGGFYGTVPGHVIITNTGAANFAGGSIDNQFIENFGTVSVTAGTSFTGNSYLENKTNAVLALVGGNLVTGPASVGNYGSIAGYGTIAVNTTNYNSVISDDTLNRAINFGLYVQNNGVTDLRRGPLNGTLKILGGALIGTNSITGSVLNAATVAPGKPFGNLAIAGNYTNLVAGLELMSIAATNQYQQLRVSGTANLAGTLNVIFTNGFFPIVGSTFTAMTYTARSGAFDSIQTPNYQFEIIYTPTALLLRASNSLPFITFNITGGNTQLVCNPFNLISTSTDLDGVVTNMEVLLNGSVIASKAGSSIKTTFESDFPQSISFVTRGQDDRGGYGYKTQQVQLLTYSMTNVLFLGGMRTNGVFKICMNGETGSNYTIFATTDLQTPFITWTNLGLMENINGIWRYLDTDATNYTYRFYRARQE